MTFAHPKILWLLAVLVPVLAAFFFWSWRRKQALVARFIHSRLVEQLMIGVSPARQKFRLTLLVAAVTLTLVALAQPQWGFRWEEAKQRGIDILVAIDTSRSMLAEDLKPNRLERAKLAALDLMQLSKTDRLGLVAFAGSAFLQCPLTLDDDAFSQSVNALQVGIIPQGGTALADTIETCQKAFKDEGDNHKVIVILTDGEDHDGGAVEAAKRAHDEGIRVFTIGIGSTEGELLRLAEQGKKPEFLRDDSGNIVKSRLNERLLQEIAGAADGFYLGLQGAKTIQMLYERGLAPLPKHEFTDKLVRRAYDRFQWPLAFAILLLVIEVFFPDRRPAARRATVSPATEGLREAVAALLLVFVAGAANASPSSAQRDYEAGRFAEAHKEYQRLLEKKSDDDRLRYNAGAAAYRAEDFENAAKHFRTAKTSRDLKLQQRAFYNMGNSLFRLGEGAQESEEKINNWEEAVKNYDGALKLDPKDKDAEFNREVVKKHLEELKKQQQQSKKNQSSDKQDQKDDKQDKQQEQKNQDQQQKNGDDKKNEQKNGDDKKQESGKDKQDQQNKDQQAKNDQQKQQQQQQEPQQQNDGKNSQPQKPGESKDARDTATTRAGGRVVMMTPEQAKQLLDSQKSDEKALIFQPQDVKPKNSNRTIKDW